MLEPVQIRLQAFLLCTVTQNSVWRRKRAKLLVPGATRSPPGGSPSSQVCSCSREHLCVALGLCHSSAACVCSCSLSPGSIEEHTTTLVLLSSIAYARLTIVTNDGTNSQIAVTFASDTVFFAPVFDHYSTGGSTPRKSFGTVKEIVSKQAHLMWGRAKTIVVKHPTSVLLPKQIIHLIHCFSLH